MCGIYAFTGRDPDAQLIAAIAAGAGRRGPHGHGWAVITPRGISTTRHLGPVADRMDAIVRESAGLHGTLLGHARMATVGAWDNRSNLQPIIAGDVALAHNGVISNPDALWPGAPTDSIALTRAYRIHRNNLYTPAQTLEKLLATAEQNAWAIVVADGMGLYAHRQHHPLYALIRPNGMYLSSHRFHAEALPLAENTTLSWAQS